MTQRNWKFVSEPKGWFSFQGHINLHNSLMWLAVFQPFTEQLYTLELISLDNQWWTSYLQCTNIVGTFIAKQMPYNLISTRQCHFSHLSHRFDILEPLFHVQLTPYALWPHQASSSGMQTDTAHNVSSYYTVLTTWENIV